MKDKNLTEAALISRGVSIETTKGQDQTTLAMQLLNKCLEDGRIEPETAALLRKVLRQFPNQAPRGRPVNVVARELMARRDAIKKVMSDTFTTQRAAWKENFERMAPDMKRFWGDYDGAPNDFQSTSHAAQSLDIDRRNIRAWREDPEYQNLVKKFYDEYTAEEG